MNPIIEDRIRLRARIGAAAMLSFSLLLGSAGAAFACGYDSAVLIPKMMLAITYPNSSYVSGAVWRAQQAGQLEMPDRDRLQATGERRAALDKVAYYRTLNNLTALGEALTAQQPENPGGFHIAMVTIETLLWTRYGFAETDTGLELHALGPRQGDLIVVSDEAALQAIRAGALSIARAVDLGVMRLYGTEDQERRFLVEFGAIGETALPAAGNAVLQGALPIFGFGRK